MASIKDLTSGLVEINALKADITTNGVSNGISIDTQHYVGIMFSTMASEYTDGTYTFAVETSDTGDFGGEQTTIADLGKNLVDEYADLTIDAVTAEGDLLNIMGVVCHTRYVRIVVTATDVTTGANILAFLSAIKDVT